MSQDSRIGPKEGKLTPKVRTALRGIDVFEGDGEVDDVEVEVVDAPVLKLLFANRLDSVVVMEGVPEFGDKEEIGTFDYAFFNGARHALTRFRFVAVITCTIKETVTRFDRIVDGIGAGVVVDFPKPGQKMSMLCGRSRNCYSPKASKGHLMAAVKLDGRGSHVGVGCDSKLLKRKW